MMYETRKSTLSKIPKVLYENRYCNQEGFSILVCGGKDKNGKVTNEVLELKIPSFKVYKFHSMVGQHFYLDLVNNKSNILAVGNRIKLDESLDCSVLFLEICSENTEYWTHRYIETEEK